MGVFKGLFVSVYASNGAIRVLFLPVCYVLLSIPFVLVLARYYRIDSSIASFLFAERSFTDTLLQVFVSLVAFLLPTRIISARSQSVSQDGRKRRVQQMPYWIPGVRHWANVVFGGEGWMKGLRDSSITPIIAYNAAGAKHNIVLSPPLLDQLLKESNSLDEAEITKWSILRNTFNMPANTKTGYLELRPEIAKTIENELFKGPTMEAVLASSLSMLSESLPDLITFNSSIVDQMPWERVAGLDLTEETVEAECDLFGIINEFFCNAIIPPITGTPFLESYQLLASDLATFNQFYYPLALGLPRLYPLPGLPGAMLAKKRLLRNFERLFDELTNPPKKKVPDDDESVSGEETDADTPTPFTALNNLFTKHDMPIQARAAIALQLLHSVFSGVVPLACWTIVHIHHAAASANSQDTKETLIGMLLAETKLWAEAVQPPSIHPSFPAPPEISFKSIPKALESNSFPLLRSCINETRRFYKSSVATLKLNKSITVTDPETLRPGIQEKWELDTGSYIDIGISQSLINTSAANFLTPNSYKPDRFLHTPPPSSVTSPSAPYETLTTALLLAFVAGVLQLWDITAAPKKTFRDHMQEAQAAAAGEKQPQASRKAGSWVVPGAGDGAGVKVPRGEVRVRIRRRGRLPERNVVRRGKGSR
ncbi:hypothetical protein K458DRAFT_445376 [Lentithecium fluviatile CBS 122367]|uniref:Cytochrome P450 n=1 Tax=Lentithecium fluviatile CBS 122367 TaxID=1168545 RepID=A0A6G1IQ98_9PLEO|nr:hypothetical protein K458DRAFT_445376 [Lentithecium fluviatile CBS 122367]